MNLKKLIPAFEWLSDYKKSDFRCDLIAGLTVGVMLVPQGMAYALLAGMPPIYGLYAGILPLIIYALLGTSRHLSIGPVAVSSMLLLAGAGQVAEPGSDRYIELVILAGLLIGFVQFFLGVFRLGFLVNFLSRPVIAGFTSAAAVIIGVSQLKYLLGIEIPRFGQLHETVSYAGMHLSEANFLTFSLGVGGIVFMLFLKKISKKIPDALLTLVLGILAVAIFKLDAKGIAVIGNVPEGLPQFGIPEITWENIKLVIPTVLTVSLIGVVESISIAKAIEAKHDYYRVVPNRELIAIGISKIGGAFFQSLPTSGSFTRSAVNNESGGRTGISSIISAVLIALTLIFLMPLFYYLPEALLASIVLLAVRSLFEWKEAIRLWKLHRSDFWMLVATFIITLVLGIEEGVIAGVLLSVMATMYSSSKPHIAILGRLPNTNYFRNINRFPEAEQDDEILIVRFDARVHFANADFFKDQVTELVKTGGKELKLLILDLSSVLEVDSTGLYAIEEICAFLASKNIKLHVSGTLGPVRDLLRKSGLMKKIGEENQFMILNDALEAYLCRNDESAVIWSPAALQTNVEDEDE